MHRVTTNILLLTALSLCAEVKLVPFRSQYPDSKPKEACTYYVDARGDTVWQGKCESWYANGRLHEQGWYRNGMKDSLWCTWSDTGSRQSKVTWLSGAIRISAHGDTLRSGSYLWRHAEGRPGEQGRYRGGKKDSVWVGQRFEVTWRRGVMDGPYVVWEGDRPLEQGACVNGKREGEWVLRCPLIGEAYYGLGHFRGGLKEGRWVEYWWIGPEDERACVTGNYVHDKREGRWQFLTSYRRVDGSVWHYRAGKRVERPRVGVSPLDTCGCGALFVGHLD